MGSSISFRLITLWTISGVITWSAINGRNTGPFKPSSEKSNEPNEETLRALSETEKISSSETQGVEVEDALKELKK